MVGSPPPVPAYAPPPTSDDLFFERDGFGYPPASRSSLKEQLSTVEFNRMWANARGAPGWGDASDFADMANQMQPGDEIWVYNTMFEVPLSGMNGLVLLRGGNVVAQIVFMVS